MFIISSITDNYQYITTTDMIAIFNMLVVDNIFLSIHSIGLMRLLFHLLKWLYYDDI